MTQRPQRKNEIEVGYSALTFEDSLLPVRPAAVGQPLSKRDEQLFFQNFNLDLAIEQGTAFKGRLAETLIGGLQQGAYDETQRVALAMEDKFREVDPRQYPISEPILRQVIPGAIMKNANLQYKIVDVVAGQILDAAGNNLRPPEEPPREPGFWEKVFGGGRDR